MGLPLLALCLALAAVPARAQVKPASAEEYDRLANAVRERMAGRPQADIDKIILFNYGTRPPEVVTDKPDARINDASLAEIEKKKSEKKKRDLNEQGHDPGGTKPPQNEVNTSGVRRDHSSSIGGVNSSESLPNRQGSVSSQEAPDPISTEQAALAAAGAVAGDVNRRALTGSGDRAIGSAAGAADRLRQASPDPDSGAGLGGAPGRARGAAGRAPGGRSRQGQPGLAGSPG